MGLLTNSLLHLPLSSSFPSLVHLFECSFLCAGDKEVKKKSPLPKKKAYEYGAYVLEAEFI